MLQQGCLVVILNRAGEEDLELGRTHDELRAMTKSHDTRDRPVIKSSARPSAKYSCSGFPLLFRNGRTAMEGLSSGASNADPVAIAGEVTGNSRR